MPIRWRLTLFNALAIGAILLVLGLGLFLLIREALLSNVEDNVRGSAATAAHALEVDESPGSGGPGVKVEGEEVERLALNGVFVLVRDAQGRVIYQTVDFSAAGEPRDSVWREALGTGEPASGTAESPRGVPYYVHAVPVGVDGGPPLVLEAGRSYEQVQETLAVFGTFLATGIGVAFLVSIGGAYFLARLSLRPVDAVVGAAREIGETDLGRRLPVANPRDEVGRLATTVNGLLSRLQAAFARREEVLARQRRFAADASHELRTPLTSISGYARMLDEWALKDPEIARESVRAIRRESGRMRDLVEALLALTRGDEGAPLEVGRCDLGRVAGEAAKTARAAAHGKVSVEYDGPDRKVEATLDEERIRQAASILLDNAVKYTPEGGSVAVRVEEGDGLACLAVSDTGMGIPEDQMPLIFERFHRADTSRTEDGAGLGLSIARQIAEAHGGAIEVRSTPGEGSTFTLLLPRKLLAREPDLPASTEVVEGPRSSG